MRAQFTQYAVPGWGTGELWIGDGLLLTHEFRFGAVLDPGGGAGTSRSRDSEPAPPVGARSSLAGTVAGNGSRVGDVFVPSSPQSLEAPATPATATATATAAAGHGLAGDLVDRFSAFFAGGDVTFDDVPIDLEWATPFQRDVATAVRTLRRGDVASYGEVAALAGYPGAARAVGTFCARNRFMFVLPCHRVVGATGVGGYGAAGADTKRRLLALEGVTL